MQLEFVLSFTIAAVIVSAAREWTDEQIATFEAGLAAFIASTDNYLHQEGTYDETKYDRNAAYKNAEQYDFIVVGAGSAGGVIANRLSEQKKWKILLLEAGVEENDFTRIPAMCLPMRVSQYSWGYKTEPQTTSCLGMVEHKCALETGKSIGGSSAINGMMYTRGNAYDYFQWVAKGNAGWGPRDVLPYFKKSESVLLETFEPRYHGTTGPLSVEEPQYSQPLTRVFQAAAAEIGLKHLDYNGREQIGFRKPQVNTLHGVRSSTGSAFVDPAASRSNLVVKTSSVVTKIIIDQRSKTAQGVEYLLGDQLFVAKASKEVIISAGAINSAQLLILSGIGPKATLDEFQIDVVANLPVGADFRDHPGFVGLNFLFDSTTVKPDVLTAHENLVSYLRYGKGPLTTVGLEAIAFDNPTDANSKQPGIEFIFVPYHWTGGPDAKANIEDNIYNELWAPLLNQDMFSIIVCLLHPKSRGSVTIKSKDPLKFPVIRTNYFSDEAGHDVDAILAGIRRAQEIVKAPAFQAINAQLNPNKIEACAAEHALDSDEYWKCAVRYVSISLRHFMSSCPMGPRKDKASVVDSHFRVHGVRRLRVADAGVIPVTISGHTNAVAIMIGERAADAIKKAWRRK